MQDLKLFIKTLLLEAGFQPDNLFEDMVDETYEILLDRLSAQIESSLKEDDLDNYLELLKYHDTMDPAMQFAKTQIPDFDAFIQEQLNEFRKEYLEHMEAPEA